jgi:hypothetical protein
MKIIIHNISINAKELQDLLDLIRPRSALRLSRDVEVQVWMDESVRDADVIVNLAVGICERRVSMILTPTLISALTPTPAPIPTPTP